LKRTLLALLIILSSGLAKAAEAPPPHSWEAWLLEIRRNPKRVPHRPDAKPASEELPVWVDCHLSWAFDRKAQRLPPGLVLRSDSAMCKGQLEEYAR
jgi:hypothetical protein